MSGGRPGVTNGAMADFFVVIGILGFFALCVAFVYGCDRIIGPDDASDLEMDAEPGDQPETVGATQ